MRMGRNQHPARHRGLMIRNEESGDASLVFATVLARKGFSERARVHYERAGESYQIALEHLEKTRIPLEDRESFRERITGKLGQIRSGIERLGINDALADEKRDD